MNCQRASCTNEARYFSVDGSFTCATCPIKEGVDSIRIADVPELLRFLRRLVASHSEIRFGADDADKIRSLIGQRV